MCSQVQQRAKACQQGCMQRRIPSLQDSGASTLVSMADSVILVPRFVLTNTQNKSTNILRTGSRRTLALQDTVSGQHLVLYNDIIIKQFSCDIYCPPASLLGVSDIFFLAMSLYSLKTTNAILNASYKAGKASRSFPSPAILTSQYYYTHVLEVTAQAQYGFTWQTSSLFHPTQ